jgi:hypothetical protein
VSKYVAMCNIPGCLPDSDPVRCDTFNEAKNVVYDWLQRIADDCEEGDASDVDRAGEFVARQVGPFAVMCDGYAYSVEEVQS